MTSKAWRPLAVAVLLCGTSISPVLAQREVDLFFGIANEIIRQGVQNEQAQRQQTYLNQQQQAEIAAQQAHELEFNTRTQTALKALGFYQMTVDGKTGPGTRAAIAAFQSAFGLSGAFNDSQLYELEWRAAEGWRSLEEVEAAEDAGFATRDEFADAIEGGFSTASSYEAARAKGFADAADYKAFIASGAPSKAAFEADKARLAAADAAVDTCFSTTQSQDWGAALAACYTASNAKPSDASAKLALETALAGAQRGLDTGRALLLEKRAALSKLLNGADGAPSADTTSLRAEVNALADDLLFIELHLQAGQCGDLIGRGQWEDSVSACAVNTRIDHLAGEKREQAEQLVATINMHLEVANTGVEAAKAELAAEAERLALNEAKAVAAQLLADVEAYGAQGRQFARGLEVAREIVALRGAAEDADSVTITQHVSALRALLDGDADYTSAQRSLAEARQDAERTAMLEARRQAELLNDFVLAYVSRNVTSNHVPTLLPLSETLDAALAEGNAERITAAQVKTRAALEQLGLEADLASFAAAYKAPQVSAEELQSAEAEAANADLALETAIAEADLLIGAIDSFAEAGGAFSDPIAVARGLSRLKAALAAPSLPDLPTLRDALADVVEADPIYASANIERQQTNDVSLANSITLATERLAGINDFLLGYIAANVTADDILAAVDLQLAIETMLAEPVSAETVRSLELVEEQLAEIDLTGQLATFLASQSARSQVAAADLSGNGLAITLANSALLEGDADDLLVLRNSAAPHLVFDLVGNLRVDGGVATTCWLHPAPTSSVSLLMARQMLNGQGVSRLAVSHCEEPLGEADLVVLRRGDFLALPPSVATPLVAAFEDGRLKQIVTVTGSDALRQSERLSAELNALAGRVGNGTAKGFGLLQLTNGHGGICAAVADLMPHGNSLVRHADTLAFMFTEPRFTAPMTAEAAFVAAQRGQCSGVYASAADLRTMSEAFERADIKFAFSPVWVEADAVEAEATRLAEESARQQQEAEAALALAAEKTADERSALLKRQDEQRAAYEERAVGAQKDIGDLVREMVQTGRSETLAELFPALHLHLRTVVADKWVVTGTVDTLADYGNATWQGRDVEAVLVRIETQRENKVLGLYAVDCVVLGYLVDREFRINRDPVEASCADSGAVADWSEGRGVESVWNLVP